MKLLISLFCLIYFSTTAQTTKKCNCSGFIDLTFKGKVNILKFPGGSIAAQLTHKFKKQDYLIFTIDSATDSFFHVKMQYAIEGRQIIGWIKKDRLPATYLRSYSRSIPLIKKPTPHPFLISIGKIPAGNSKSFPIIDCESEYIRTSFKTKNEIIVGCIAKENLCGNPYTTCN